MHIAKLKYILWTERGGKLIPPNGPLLILRTWKLSLSMASGLPLTRISACLHADLVNDTRTRTFCDFIADMALKNSLNFRFISRFTIRNIGKNFGACARTYVFFSQNLEVQTVHKKFQFLNKSKYAMHAKCTSIRLLAIICGHNVLIYYQKFRTREFHNFIADLMCKDTRIQYLTAVTLIDLQCFFCN